MFSDVRVVGRTLAVLGLLLIWVSSPLHPEVNRGSSPAGAGVVAAQAAGSRSPVGESESRDLELKGIKGKAAIAEPPQDEDLEILINTRDLHLSLLKDSRTIKVYPIAAGKPSTPSPRGRYMISCVVRFPTWFPKGRSPVPPGPSNPLGSRWLGLSGGPYGIHGTNDDSSIGKHISKGCIRMHNADVEELCGLVGVGIPVIITDLRAAGESDGDRLQPGERRRALSEE